MTRFYWVDTAELAADDAADKGYASGEWIWCATRDELAALTVSDYAGIYMRTGVMELEQEFARIMKRSRPSWLC